MASDGSLLDDNYSCVAEVHAQRSQFQVAVVNCVPVHGEVQRQSRSQRSMVARGLAEDDDTVRRVDRSRKVFLVDMESDLVDCSPSVAVERLAEVDCIVAQVQRVLQVDRDDDSYPMVVDVLEVQDDGNCLRVEVDAMVHLVGDSCQLEAVDDALAEVVDNRHLHLCLQRHNDRCWRNLAIRRSHERETVEVDDHSYLHNS